MMLNKPLNNLRSNKGFSIIELAIVMVIIGILLIGGLTMIAPLTKRAKKSQTNDIMDAAVAAIAGYAEINDMIPVTTVTSGTVGFASVVRKSTDIWNKDIAYIADPNLSSDSVCSRNSTEISIDFCADAACTSKTTTNNVAFMAVSGGANLNMQTDTTVNPVKIYNYGMFGVDDYATGLSRSEAYDDIVKWMVLPELRVKAGCSGSPLKILNIDLPSGYVLSSYNTDIVAVDGTPWDDGDDTVGDADEDPDYEWCVTGSLPSDINYECDGALAVTDPLTNDCSLTDGTWQKCTKLNISGTPDAGNAGAYSLPIYVRDNASNITSRTYALTFSLVTGLHLCDEYRVWNEGTGRDMTIDGVCYLIASGNEATAAAPGLGLNSGEQFLRWDGASGTCGGSSAFLSYNDAVLADNNMDCCINFDTTDKTCL
jgi:prepilin-type N-terminal cleavage/methylation domain-containing protein